MRRRHTRGHTLTQRDVHTHGCTLQKVSTIECEALAALLVSQTKWTGLFTSVFLFVCCCFFSFPWLTYYNICLLELCTTIIVGTIFFFFFYDKIHFQSPILREINYKSCYFFYSVLNAENNNKSQARKKWTSSVLLA